MERRPSSRDGCWCLSFERSATWPMDGTTLVFVFESWKHHFQLFVFFGNWSDASLKSPYLLLAPAPKNDDLNWRATSILVRPKLFFWKYLIIQLLLSSREGILNTDEGGISLAYGQFTRTSAPKIQSHQRPEYPPPHPHLDRLSWCCIWYSQHQ